MFSRERYRGRDVSPHNAKKSGTKRYHSPPNPMDARVALLRCHYPPMGKSKIIVPHMYSDVKVPTGAISPLGWCSFAATVVLFYREGGAKTPCKWCFQPVIYVLLRLFLNYMLISENAFILCLHLVSPDFRINFRTVFSIDF